MKKDIKQKMYHTYQCRRVTFDVAPKAQYIVNSKFTKGSVIGYCLMYF